MSAENTVETAEQWQPPKNPWPATAAIMLATFIFVLDSTIANVALPHMAGSFSSTNEEAMWILTSYMVASGIILPSVAWFSSVFGRKNFFISCVLLFTIASFFCGLAKSLDQMILARILQGLGGGAILPVSQAILLENFPKEKRRMSMSIFAFGVILAPIIGPILGGWITDNYSWHWIFYINVPLGFLAAFLSSLFIVDPPYAKKQSGQKIDYVGFGFLILWLVTLQITLDKGQNLDWFNSPMIRTLALVSVISMILFIVSQLKDRDSLIDLKVFDDKNFAVGTALLVFINGIMYASIVIMPLFLQHLLRYSAFWSGFATTPRGIGCIIAIVITGLAKKADDRVFISLGLAMLGTASLIFGNLNLQISMINILIPNLIFGMGMGFCIVSLSSLAVVTLKNEQLTNATGIQNLFKNIGGAIGTSVVATCLSRFAQMHQAQMVGNLNNLNPVFQYKVKMITAALSHYMHGSLAYQKANYLMYAELLRQSNLWAFMDAFRVFGLLCFIISPIVFFMDRGHGHVSSDDDENMTVMH